MQFKKYIMFIFLGICCILVSCNKSLYEETEELMIGIRDNDIEKVKIAIDKNPKTKYNNEFISVSGKGIVQYAIETNDIEIVRLVIDKKNVNMFSRFFPPLYITISMDNNKEIFDYLISCGASTAWKAKVSSENILETFLEGNITPITWDYIKPYVSVEMYKKCNNSIYPIEKLLIKLSENSFVMDSSYYNVVSDFIAVECNRDLLKQMDEYEFNKVIDKLISNGNESLYYFLKESLDFLPVL